MKQSSKHRVVIIGSGNIGTDIASTIEFGTFALALFVPKSRLSLGSRVLYVLRANRLLRTKNRRTQNFPNSIVNAIYSE